MTLALPDLPFDKRALTPHISEKTLEFHYGKHHKAYADNTNSLVEGTDLAGKDLETLLQISAKDASRAGLFNNAAQAWNHSFYWNCITPGGGGHPSGQIAAKIDSAFGSFDGFAKKFKEAGVTQFGSGWAWLVLKGDNVAIMQTGNADTPLAHGLKPLLTVDVWEHAYYLDYQNRRADYLAAFIDHLINWDFVNSQLGKGWQP